MSNMIACTGNCGVTQHIAGSDAARQCAARTSAMQAHPAGKNRQASSDFSPATPQTPTVDDLDDLLEDYTQRDDDSPSPLQEVIDNCDDEREKHAWKSLDRSLSAHAQDIRNAENVTVDESNPRVQQARAKVSEGMSMVTNSQTGERTVTIGYMVVDEGFSKTDASYENASWYQEHHVEPGVYPIKAQGFDPMTPGKPRNLIAEYDTTLGGSNFTSQYGGVNIGTPVLDKNKGEEGKYSTRRYAYEFPTVYADGISWDKGSVFLCDDVDIEERRGTTFGADNVPSIHHDLKVDMDSIPQERRTTQR